MKNDQKEFWKGNFGDVYRENNTVFDDTLSQECWSKMLAYFDKDYPKSILECGSNIGRNLQTLNVLLEDPELSLIELNQESFEIAKQRYNPRYSFNGPINKAPFENESFDLVFTSGVLIHVNPDDLFPTLEKMYQLSKKYILIAEYFSREPESPIYHGEKNKLFKMDFGKYLMQNFPTKLLDYGFLWGHIYDDAGFDDITWWLFEKS
tara:strand:- start:168 stop:788 length:621 start_codon:yes stop_codon:yes gene_type:complete